MRLDGDPYEWTLDGLGNLYPQLSEGGHIVIDDYGVFDACLAAVDEFRQMVEELRSLPVAEEAQAAVTQWLAIWDAFNDLGAQYADDLQAAGEFVEMSEEADLIDGVLRTIADVSGMPACDS